MLYEMRSSDTWSGRPSSIVFLPVLLPLCLSVVALVFAGKRRAARKTKAAFILAIIGVVIYTSLLVFSLSFT